MLPYVCGHEPTLGYHSLLREAATPFTSSWCNPMLRAITTDNIAIQGSKSRVLRLSFDDIHAQRLGDTVINLAAHVKRTTTLTENQVAVVANADLHIQPFLESPVLMSSRTCLSAYQSDSSIICTILRYADLGMIRPKLLSVPTYPQVLRRIFTGSEPTIRDAVLQLHGHRGRLIRDREPGAVEEIDNLAQVSGALNKTRNSLHSVIVPVCIGGLTGFKAKPKAPMGLAAT
jgi:hypothetical protein